MGMKSRAFVLLGAALLAAACARPVKTARLSPLDPPSMTENQAALAVKNRRCNPLLALAVPGLGHMCLRRDAEAAGFAAVAAGEIAAATAIIVTHDDDPSTLVEEEPPVTAPLTALQDLWIYGVVDALFTTEMARGKLYTPQDTPVDLVAAPFNWEVMKRPTVWAGILGALAVGIGVSLAIDQPGTEEVGDDPKLFGKRVDGRWGYPAAGAMTWGLFSHVAIAEDALFRGWLQSSIARSRGETVGWGIASLAFGAVHLGNLSAIEREDWDEYLLYGMPVITAAGFYLGWQYRHEGYSLAPPVAVHFWYDTILSAVIFALDPDDNFFTTKFSMPF